MFQCTQLILIYVLFPWDVPLQFMLTHVFPECPSIDLSFSKPLLCSPKSYTLFLRFPPYQNIQTVPLFRSEYGYFVNIIQVQEGNIFRGKHNSRCWRHNKNEHNSCCPGIWESHLSHLSLIHNKPVYSMSEFICMFLKYTCN